MMTSQIRSFLKQLLFDAGQTDLPQEVENQMIEDLYTRLEDRLMLSAMEHLSEEQQEVLDRMTEEGKSADEVETFLKSAIPNYDEVFRATLEDFRNTYIEGSAQ